MVDFWVKCVNQGENSDTLELVEATEDLEGGEREKIPRNALAAELNAGNDIRTAHKEGGSWKEGERVVVRGQWITTESNENPDGDDLGGLKACKI